MCGLAGKLWFDAARPADREVVAAMTAAQRHRGPDGMGLWSDGPIALGHRRLAIVDLSPTGAQPMVSRDDPGLVLVANGEIYNHAALRDELSARGHRFAGRCDNEVILAAYREWWPREGHRFLERLEGMFAFALWDTGARRLVLARDRVGQKPLAWSADGQRIAFASELQALRHEPSLDRTPDWEALSDYLSFRTVPHPRSAWVGAQKLAPGHVLVVEAEGFGAGGAAPQLEPVRWWRLAPGSDTRLAPSFDEAAHAVRELLDAAVRRRLMSDVPLGALLSGGLDSAAIVALMARHHDGPVKTFTIGWDERAYDESTDALAVARAFRTDHHVEVVQPDALSLVDDLLQHYGEPFADGSALPTFLVSRLARRHVKVVLTGDGGDENFAGYDRYRALALAERLSSPWAAPLRWALDLAAPHARTEGQRSFGTRLRRFVDVLPAAPRRRNHLWRLGLDEPVRQVLLTRKGADLFGSPSFYGSSEELPFPLNEQLVLDVERYLPDDILVKLDIASMAHGLEARSPFLDRALMEYAAALPGRYKLRGRSSKAVLRAAVADLLPPDLVSGPKRGFGAPLDAWFRGPLAGHVREVLLSPAAAARGLFEPRQVQALIEGHEQRKVAAHDTLLTLLVLERWFLAEESWSGSPESRTGATAA